MTIAEYRRRRGITQEAATEELGLKSKGFFSRIENGEAPSLRLALKIEEWSGGTVPAESLLAPEDAALLAAHRARAGAPALQPEAAA